LIEKKEEKSICSCSARKKAIYEDTLDIRYGNSINNINIDVLILQEFKEKEIMEERFHHLCKIFLQKENINYVIINALGCTPEGYGSTNTILTYKKCKHTHVKEIIHSYNPKVIITTGRAIYTITESKDLIVPDSKSDKSSSDNKEDSGGTGGHFYSDYIDERYLYSPEFKCEVYPIPPLYRFIPYDNYETQFFKEQLKLVINSVKKRKERKINIKSLDLKDFLPLIHF
jgi:hypothetical protein